MAIKVVKGVYLWDIFYPLIKSSEQEFHFEQSGSYVCSPERDRESERERKRERDFSSDKKVLQHVFLSFVEESDHIITTIRK